MEYNCSEACECKNNPKNWNCCRDCGIKVCDFNDSPPDWIYDDEEEFWLCPLCIVAAEQDLVESEEDYEIMPPA